ncbi:hypothetical protein MHK_000581 [Candidatus Magnetomorum sp. HK-1]|nr:hypothetical protein MHK_000581 [Candidatus Magnetomorum sp. HK-1]
MIGSYGGEGLKKLAEATNGDFFYSKTSDGVYKNLNAIVGPLGNTSRIIPCLYSP